MENNIDDLDDILDEFQTPQQQQTKEEEKSLKQTIEQIGEEPPLNFDLGNMQQMIEQLANELSNNTQLQQEIENIGKQFLGENVMQDSIGEITGKLQDYIDSHRLQLSQADLNRYQQQLIIYQQIGEAFTNNRDMEAMQLVAKLSQYGELPPELVPPMPDDCSIF